MDTLNRYPKTTRLKGSVLLLGLFITGAAIAADGGLCDGYNSAKKIRRLGGRNAFVPGGVESLADLQAVFVNHEEELRGR